MSHVNVTKAVPALYEAQIAVEKAAVDAAEAAGLHPLLLDLVRLRASQLNGCAFCLRMHTQDAMKNGETADRLAVVAAWWESQYFTEKEQAALTLAEQVTLIGNAHTSPAPKVDVAAILTKEEIAAITALAISINGWNRLAITSGYPVAP
ncbi:MAG: carboxymuconolactone decarboxylase family protein [Nocardioides sp.]